jgi:hypothetical protein
MKTTIEVNGYEIVIEETEGTVSVSAMKDGETVEEFTLEGEEGGEEVQSFGEYEEEEDFGDEEGEEEEEELEEEMPEGEEIEEEMPEGEEIEEEEEEENVAPAALESFSSYMKKKNNSKMTAKKNSNSNSNSNKKKNKVTKRVK